MEVVVEIIVEMEVEMVEEVVLLALIVRSEVEEVQEEVVVSPPLWRDFGKRLVLVPAGAAVDLGGELSG